MDVDHNFISFPILLFIILLYYEVDFDQIFISYHILNALLTKRRLKFQQ